MNEFLTIGDVRAAFTSAVRRSTRKDETWGRLFRYDGGGSYTRSVPGGRSRIYVRVYYVGAVQLTEAIDLLGTSSPTDDDKAVILDKIPEGWAVVRFRDEN